MRDKARMCILLFLIVIMAFSMTSLETFAGNEYWPTNGWQTSTPEEQGMDSEKILKMLEFIEKSGKKINSVLIIRHGFLVTEAYFAPYRRDVKQQIQSCTKSFTSAAVGAAMMDGKIQCIDQKVVAFFPEFKFANMDSRKESMTVRNLLTMRSGLDWPEQNASYAEPNNPALAMYRSNNIIQYILDHPMEAEPGTQFDYNTGDSQLLSAIIQKTTGKKTSEYVNEKLFAPMGIKDYLWSEYFPGMTSGGIGLALLPRDMAKFGYLYLRNGVWDGQRILPEGWVDASTQRYDKLNAWDGETAPIGYGYQWWTHTWGYYAWGVGGQCICVLPKQDLVLVFTGILWDTDQGLPFALIQPFIIPAVKSEEKLLANPKAVEKLNTLLGRLVSQPPQPVRDFPVEAGRISGKTYEISPNRFGVEALSLRFVGGDHCYLGMKYPDLDVEFPVGLDDGYHCTKIQGFGEFALKGYWLDDHRFAIDFYDLERPDILSYIFYFRGRNVDISITTTVPPISFSLTGKMKK